MNPKVKGGNFEREIAKALSLWITNGQREDVFWRSAMSGGRATIAQGKVRQCGDLCAVADEGWAFSQRWFVELKHVKKLALDQFMVKGTGPLANFWRITLREAKKYQREPMIIARQNGWPILVITKPGQLIQWTAPIIHAEYLCDVSLFEAWMENGRSKPPKRIPR